MTQGEKKWKEGLFQPRNPEKYVGEMTKTDEGDEGIEYKSSWEERAFEFLDNNPNVLEWSYEPIGIGYKKPIMINGRWSWKPATYFPDLFVKYIHRDGNIIKELIEVKPLKQTKKSRSKKESVRLQEDYVVIVNNAKWEAAKAWCEKYGIKFSILTEKSLFR